MLLGSTATRHPLQRRGGGGGGWINLMALTYFN